MRSNAFFNKVVWITGASSGIGEALAQAFAQAGARVILSARRLPELERVRLTLPQPENHRVLLLDLMQTGDMAAQVREACQFFGRLDVLVHNGGISQRGYAQATPLEIDRRIMEVNYFGAIALTKAVLPVFQQQQSGHFVVISSLVGKLGSPMRSAYAASKHALHGFFDSLRAEVAREKMSVTLVCPGYIRTRISYNALTETGAPHARLDKNQEKGMLPAKCAALIVAAVSRKEEEILIGGKETLAVYLKRYFPGLLSKLLRRLATPR